MHKPQWQYYTSSCYSNNAAQRGPWKSRNGTTRLLDLCNSGFMDELSFVFEISTVSAVISADADISGSQSASLLRHSGRRAGIQSLFRVTPVRLPCV